MEWRRWLTRAFGFGFEIGSDRVVGIGDRGGEVVTSRLPFVTPHLARCLPVVFACDRVIAEAMATSTPRLMRGDTPVPSHPILDVFRHPGPFESLSELLSTAQSDLDMWGNCYLLPLRTRAGTLVELEYLSASAMAVYGDTRRDDGSRVIEYHHEDLGTLRRERGSPPPLLHVRQNRPGYDSWIGKSAIRFMRESVSAGLSSVEFHARQMLEGGHSQLALTTDQDLDPETIQKNADAFNAATKGPRRWFATPFLPRGITPVPLAVGQTLARAFEGASGFLGALKSLASRVAGTFLSQFGGWLSTGLQRVLPSVFGAAGTAAGTATGTAAATATGGSLFSGLGGVIGAIPGWGWAAAGVGAAFAFFKGFGGPSKAELEARKTFGAFRERAIAEMGQTQAYIDEVQHAVNVGWDRTLAETRAAFIITGTAAGVAYDEAFRIYGQYEKSVRDGNTALMAQIELTYAQWQQQARDTAAANIAEAEREAAARDALNATIDRVVGYYRQARDEAKKEGTEARQAALASGKSRQEAEAIGKNAAAKAYETRKRLRIKEMAEEAAFQAALQAIKNGNARGAAAAARQAYNQTRKAGRLAFNAVETASGKTRRGLSKDFQTVRTNAKKNLDQVQHGATGNFDQILRDAKDSLSQIGTDGWDELTDTARQAVTTQKDLALKEFDALQTEMESTLGAIGGDLDRTFRGRDYTVTQHLRSTGSHQPVEPRQHGGPVRPGRPYLVGEAGPEILIPRVSGTIAPIGRSGSAAAVAAGIDYQALGLAVAAALRASPPVVTLDGRRVTASVLRHEPSMTAFEGLR